MPCDPCIESLALSGALQMARFLEGRDVGRAISWDGDGNQAVLVEVLQQLMPSTIRRALAASWLHRRYRTTAAAALLVIAVVRRLRPRADGIRAKARRVAAIVGLLGSLLTARSLASKYDRRATRGPQHADTLTNSGLRSSSARVLNAPLRSESAANLERLL